LALVAAGTVTVTVPAAPPREIPPPALVVRLIDGPDAA